MSSVMVGREMYLPPDNSSPFFTTAGISTSIVWLRSISGRYTWIAISDSIMRKLIKRRRVFFADKIRSHPVPDDYDYMPLRFQRTGCDGRHAEAPQKQCDHSRHVR